MATFTCKNFGSCSRADAGETLALAAGADEKCPECGATLVADKSGADAVSATAGSKRIWIGIAIAALLAVIWFVHAWWMGSKVLRPDQPQTAPRPVTSAASSASPASSASASAASVSATAGSTAAPSSTSERPIERPPAMLASEASARRTCDEAVAARHSDADRLCRRAAAITLMNAGALAAIGGKLEQAEKDYVAARDKDPELPELYFNLAVLKARQGKGSEAIDNLTLAKGKGFTQFAAVRTEPALQALKGDPVLKQKLEEFEPK